jgi:CelD/BcsL family acetyltransferase involved in cellulose biosynthesis
VHGTIEAIFRVEWRPLSELADVGEEWRALGERALEPNVFYEADFALAAAPVFGRDAGAGLVWSRTTPPRLLGFFPARIERRRYGVPFPVLTSWTHPYAPLGTPLVDRRSAEAVIGAWFEHVSRDPAFSKRLLMPLVPMHGAFAEAFDAAIASRGGTSVAYAHHQRALLAPDGNRAAYIDNAVGRKKLKEMRRQLRRLGESGTLTFETATEPAPIAAALGDFLTLESTGWKGRAGTAARHHAVIRGFMEMALPALARDGKASIVRLVLDGRTIAALVVLRSQDTAWAWKIAYDESAARASPGVQILLHATEALLSDETLARADSCATANHPMIDHVWRERLALADRLVRIGPDGGASFAVVCMLEGLRRNVITAAKRVRAAIRRG